MLSDIFVNKKFCVLNNYLYKVYMLPVDTYMQILDNGMEIILYFKQNNMYGYKFN